MLRITANGYELDLSESTTVQIKRSNPMFSSTNWEDGYSYSFVLPKTARNTSVLYSRNLSKQNVKIIVSFHGIEFIRGNMRSIKKAHNSITLNLVDDSIDLRNKLEATDFEDLDLPSVTVCEEADTPTTKVTKWRDHMQETTFNTPVNEGPYKFPRIYSRSYSDWEGEDPNYALHIHRVNNGVVNAHQNGQYLLSAPVPISFDPEPTPYKHWMMTVSPCLRIQYILEKIAEQLNIGKIESELFNISEFTNMITFSGYTLDDQVADGSSYLNVFGLGFDLNDFLPESKWISLFDMLSEMFGAFYSHRNGILKILLKKDILSKKPINMSKYCSEEYVSDELEDVYFKFSFAENPNAWPVWYYSDTLDTFQAQRLYPNQDVHVNKTVDIDETEVEFSYYPMTSTLANVRLFDDYNDILFPAPSDVDFGTGFWYDIDFIHSDELGEANRSKIFNPGVIRGLYPTLVRSYDANGILTGTSVIDSLVQYSYNHLMISEETQATYASYIVEYGNSSIYGSEDQNAFDLYQSAFYNLISESVEIPKQLALPPHVLIELMKWENPIHVIEQGNMSFRGVVKDISFTLSNRSISRTTVTYVVEKNDLKGDFNRDYSDDYSI